MTEPTTQAAPSGTVGALVGQSRSVYYGHGLTYNAHCWTGLEITSDSLRNIKRAAKLLGWTCADITREDLLPEWVSRCGRYASESYLWFPRRKPNTRIT